MKKLNAFLVSVLSAAALNAAVIEQVIVRQQWPWSTDVKVEYKLSAVTNPVDITIQAFNGDTELPLPATAVTGDRYGIAEDGVGTLVIDPVTAFGTAKVALANFKVKLSVTDSPANLNEVTYKVFSLTNAQEAVVEISRKELLNGKYGSVEISYGAIGEGFNTSLSDVLIWTGVTNNIKYKTTHLVMRRIPAKEYGEWTIGSPEDEIERETKRYQPPETQHTVKLMDNYYIGVFELTQAQYANIAKQFTTSGNWPSSYTGEDRDVHPVESISYLSIRSKWVDWPTTQPLHHINEGSTFLSWIRRATGGCEFDLPTDAQWEFACRAGTETALSDGRKYTYSTCNTHTKELAWVACGGTSRGVGLLKPNAYGLYDMHGNVAEWCVDWMTSNIDVDGTGDPLIDPKGATSNSNNWRATRGGAFSADSGNVYTARSAYRYGRPADGNGTWLGVRLVCPENATW